MKLQDFNLGGQEGLTLVELIIALTLVIVLSLFLAYLLVYQNTIYTTQNAELTIAGDARSALDDIDNYVRQSYRVLSSYSTYTTGSQTLVLQIPAIDSSSQIISGSYDAAVFYLSGTNLYRQVFPVAGSSRLAATKKLASNVSTGSFAFTYNNASYASVTQVNTNIVISQNVGGAAKSITISSEAILRNY